MRRCVRADLRALRKLERHTAWLQQHIPSKHIQQQRKRQVFELRSDLCQQLSCAGNDIEAVIDQSASDRTA